MQGIDLDALLRPALAALQEVAQAECGFLGFPISAEFGGNPVTLHWQAFRLPRLRKRFAKGFRDKEHGHWIYNLANHFTTNTAIPWLPSENWNADQLSTRGRLPRELRDCSVAVLGAGAPR